MTIPQFSSFETPIGLFGQIRSKTGIYINSVFSCILFLTLIQVPGWAQCPSTGVTLLSQGDVNSFVASYPDCTIITGDLIIGPVSGSSTITDLSGLNSLLAITGNLIIRNNGLLTNLNGLNSINNVTGGLTIFKNSQLNSLSGLSDLLTVNERIYISDNGALPTLNGLAVQSCGGLIIENNDLLEDLSGLGSLTFIHNELRISNNNALLSLFGLGPIGSVFNGSIEINGNPFLADINVLTHLAAIAANITIVGTLLQNISFSSLVTVGGYLSIGSNSDLEAIQLGSLNTAGAIGITGNSKLLSIYLGVLNSAPYINISYNPLLTNMSGLSNLTTIGTLYVTDNPLLTSLNAFSGLATANNIEISRNSALVSLAGLGNLNKAWLFTISNNQSLENLGGLTSLDSVEHLGITSNPALTNLTGMEGLLYANTISLESNSSITGLNGLGSENTYMGSNSSLWVSNNALLSGCSTPFVCNYLNRPSETAYFENNTSGCNSLSQVQTICGNALLCTWLGGNGHWEDASQWDCGKVPNFNDTVVINGGAITLNANKAVAALKMNDGQILGNANLAIEYDLTWNKGSLNLSGVTTVGGLFSSVNPAPASNLGNLSLNNGTLILNGGAILENPKMAVANGATLTLPSGTTMTINTTNAVNATSISAGGGNLTLLGQIVKNGSKGFSISNPMLSIVGAIQVNQGVFGLGGNPAYVTTITGATINIASGATFRLNPGTANLINTAFTGNGFFDTSVGTTNLNGGNTFSASLGTITVSSGGKLNVNQSVSMRSLAINATSSILSICGPYTLQITFGLTNNGKVQGSGNIEFVGTAFMTNNGTLAPGCSPGTLNLTINNYTNSILDIELVEANGTVSVDLLSIIGNLNLNGSTLNVTETPCIQNGIYNFIQYTGTRTGSFGTLNLPPGYSVVYDDAGKRVRLQYNDPAPVITCPANQTIVINTGNSSPLGAWSPASLTDNCMPSVTVAQSPAAGTLLEGGCDMETVTLTATDGNNSSSNCSFMVTLSLPETCNGLDDNCDGQIDEGFALLTAVKVFLQGPYVSSAQLMHDSLRVKGLIPLQEPYTGLSGFTHVGGGGEQTTPAVLAITGNNAIVDWVFLELRSTADPALVLATRSALLQRDGDVVDVDGMAPVAFSIPAGSSYFPVVRHRNHLGVQLGEAVPYPHCVATETDFRSLPPQGFYAFNGLNPAQKLIGSTYVLWAGNGRIDFQLKYNGSNNDRNAVLTVVGLATPNAVVPGYNLADYNLDGVVKYNGSANDRNVLLGNVGIATPSAVVFDQVAR